MIDKNGLLAILSLNRTRSLEARTARIRFFINKALSGLCAIVFLTVFLTGDAWSQLAGQTQSQKVGKRLEYKRPVPPLVSTADANRMFMNLQWELRAVSTCPPIFDRNKGIEPIRKILLTCFDYFATVEQIQKVTASSPPQQQLQAAMQAIEISLAFFERVRSFLNEQQALSPELADYRPDPFKPRYVEYSMRLALKDLSSYFLQNGIGLIWTSPPKILTGELLLGDIESTAPTEKDRVAVPLFPLPKLFFIVEGLNEVTTVGPKGTQNTWLVNARQFNLEKCYRSYLANRGSLLRLEPGGPVPAQGLCLLAYPWVLLLKDQQESHVDSLVSTYRRLSNDPQTIAQIHDNPALKLLPVILPLLSVYEKGEIDPRYPHTQIVMQYLYRIVTCKLLVELTEGKQDASATATTLKEKLKMAAAIHELAHQAALETDTARMLEQIRHKTSSKISEADADEAEVLIEMGPRFEDLKSSLLGVLLMLQADQPWDDEDANLSFKPDLLLYQGMIGVMKRKAEAYGLSITKQGLAVFYNVEGKRIEWLLDEEAQIVIQFDRVINSGLSSQLVQDVREELHYDERVKALIGKYRNTIPLPPRQQ